MFCCLLKLGDGVFRTPGLSQISEVGEDDLELLTLPSLAPNAEFTLVQPYTWLALSSF